ncbi:MAG: beta-ketoacyl-ACP synthase, partial [Microcystaceae cyanobacterium]
GNLQASWQGIKKGSSGIGFRQPFPNFAPLPMGLIQTKPSFLVDLVPAIALDAVKDAQLAPDSDGWGVVVGSSRGCQGMWEQWVAHPENIGDQWLRNLPDLAALLTARQLQKVEVLRSPMAACATGLWAIRQGCELIQSGECQRVLAGAVEAPITPLTLAGFQQMGALAPTGCYPFSREREGLVLGEGGAILVLESAETALARKAKIYGMISGWGFSNDAHHVSAPAQDNRAASRAIAQALSQAQINPTAIDFIHAHGTATSLNDQREADLIKKLWGNQVLVTSTKGATGHTLGASGAIAVAFSLLALYHQQLLPTIGLKTPDFDLNFVRESHPNLIKNILCLSFGFGGQNAAMILKSFVN